MYARPPSNARSQHPFHMYDEIKLGPEVVRRSLERVADQGDETCRAIAGARRVLLTGCGTSYFAAQVGAWLLQGFSRGKIEAWAVESFELAVHVPSLRPDDLVIGVSHSGGTPMTLKALQRAASAGADTVAVTGFPESAMARQARHLLPTGYAEERSWAHTASYLAALATFAAVAGTLAEAEERLDLSQLPEVVGEALGLEEMAHRLAASAVMMERSQGSAPIVIVGSGPNAATAQEGMLKLQETSFVPAQAFELEEMLHGPLAAVTPETLLIVLAPGGAATERTVDLTRAVQHIGIEPVVLAAESVAGRFENGHRLTLADVPEILSPIPFVVPLHLFSYFLSVGKGLNPDLIRRDDERYRAARASYT